MPPRPHPDQLVVLLQGQRGRLSSQPALDYRGEMEEGDAEGGGPMAVREGPSGHGLPPNANNTTTTNLLASVKEQVGGRRCCSHALVVVCLISPHLLTSSFTFNLQLNSLTVYFMSEAHIFSA